LRKIRNLPAEKGGNVPALALTAFAGEKDREMAFAAGFQMHVPKPVDLAKLTTSLLELGKRGHSALH
jgi:CheY-like chemotaxis protein